MFTSPFEFSKFNKTNDSPPKQIKYFVHKVSANLLFYNCAMFFSWIKKITNINAYFRKSTSSKIWKRFVAVKISVPGSPIFRRVTSVVQEGRIWFPQCLRINRLWYGWIDWHENHTVHMCIIGKVYCNCGYALLTSFEKYNIWPCRWPQIRCTGNFNTGEAQWTESSLVQVVACRCVAPRQYINQCCLSENMALKTNFCMTWIIISFFLWSLKKMH